MSLSTASDHRPTQLSAAVATTAAAVVLAFGALFYLPHRPAPTQQDRIAELTARRSELRNAADLYYHEHGHRYPGEYDPADGRTPYHRGQEGQAADAFARQLTQYTDRDGKASTRRSTRYHLGPYLPAHALPANPLMHGGGADRVQIDFTLQRPFVVYPPDGRTGWRYYIHTGRLAANDNVRLRNGARVDYQ